MPTLFNVVFWFLMLGRVTTAELVTIESTIERCQQYAGIVEQWSDLRPREFENDLDTDLVLAVMAAESHCIPGQTSYANAVGLMQVIPRDWLGKDLHVPRVNIYWGMWILDNAITKAEGDLPKALAAYNCGFDRVEADLCGPHGGYNYAETVLEWRFWMKHLDNLP